MRQDNPYAGFERVTPQAATASPASSYAGFQPALPRPAQPQPRPQAAPIPSAAPDMAYAPAPAMGAAPPLLTVEEMAAANMASGYDPQKAWDLAQEDFANQTQGADPGMATAQPAAPAAIPSPLDDLRIHRPEFVNMDAAAALAQRASAYTGPGSSAENPFVLRPDDESTQYRDALQSLSRGMYVATPEGVRRLSGDPYINENPDANDTRIGQAVLREENLADQGRAFAMGAAEQIPFLDEAAVAAAGAISGRGYSDTRDSYQALQAIDNQVNRDQRVAGGLTGFATALALPAGGRFVSQGVTSADRMRRAALASGLTSSVYSAGSGEGALTERAERALRDGLISAATGGVLQRGVDRLARPTADTAQRRLSRQGQELTIGQMFGGGVQRTEDALTSVPFAGDMIRNRQRETLASFDNVATNVPLARLGRQLNDTSGRAGVRAADDIISSEYRTALAPVSVDAADPVLASAIAQARIPDRLTANVSADLNATLDNIFSQASGVIDGETWKRVDSDLAAAITAAQAGSATQPAMTAMRNRLQEARAAWRDNLGRVDPAALSRVDDLDRSFAEYSLIRQASSDAASAARGGDASPATLNRAVAQSGSRRGFARGENLLQDLTDDAMQVLPRTVPDSGTPLRSLVTGAGLGGGGAALGVDPVAIALGAALTGGVSAAYSRPAQQLANQLYRASDTGGTTRDVAGLAEALRRAPVGVSLVSPDGQNSTQARRRVSQ